MTILIRLQRILFSVAAGFWLVAGTLAAFGIVDLGFGSADAARGVGILMLGNGVALRWQGGSRCAASVWWTSPRWPWLR